MATVPSGGRDTQAPGGRRKADHWQAKLLVISAVVSLVAVIVLGLLSVRVLTNQATLDDFCEEAWVHRHALELSEDPRVRDWLSRRPLPASCE